MDRLLFIGCGASDDALLLEELHGLFLVQGAHFGGESLSRARLWKPNTLVLNIEGPVNEAAALIRALRSDSTTENSGVVAITERTDFLSEDSLYGSGADLVIHRPIGIRSLLLRISSLVRRVSGRVGASSFVTLGELVLDISNGLIRLPDHTTTPVSTRSMKLLVFLARHQEHIFSREQLRDAVWPDKEISTRSIDAYISKLKKQVPALNRLILKVYGKGYRVQARSRAA